ncbi:MAG: hypothetical protein SOS24_08300, partial [Clostridia bacterium]|nr:hypothetical protein [Clostridia bacterium]
AIFNRIWKNYDYCQNFSCKIRDFTQFALIKSAQINILRAKYLFGVQGVFRIYEKTLHLNNYEMLLSRYAAAFHNCSAVIKIRRLIKSINN